jgi:hypothetical protein
VDESGESIYLGLTLDNRVMFPSAPKSLESNGWSEMETGMWDKFSQDDEV